MSAQQQKKSVADRIRDLGFKAESSVGTNSEGEVVIDYLGRKIRIFNIVDFIEAPWGLQMRLFPVQKFITKLYYHLPLDDRDKIIEVNDRFNEKVLYTLTEKEYLHYLYNEGRCNIKEQDHMRRQLILPVGRRSGKSTISAAFASYELYRLLSMPNPQEYYGLPNGNRIQLVSVATDKDQAGILFNEVTGHMAKCEWFKDFLNSNTQSMVQYRTQYDIEKYGKETRWENGKFQSSNGKASVRLTFKAAVSKGLRGAGNIVMILDEMAHFQSKGSASAEDIYNAIGPSGLAFSPKDPVTRKPIGGTDTRVICISSPLNKQGKFFSLYQQSLQKGEASVDMLMVQAPTWEVNPTVDSKFLRQKYYEDPRNFDTEFGAQFSDRVRGWIERSRDLTDCIVPGLRPTIYGPPRQPHQMGIDIGVVNDGTSVAITHVDRNRIVLDYHEVWYAGRSWKEANPHLIQPITDYAKSLEDVERLDFEAIAEWIEALTRRFLITKGVFDRFEGIALEQALHRKGLKQFESLHWTRDLGTKVFQDAKMLMFDKKLALYDYPSVVGQDGVVTSHGPLIQELLALQATQHSKNQVTVEAPKVAGAHDDVSDALVRSIYLSAQLLSKTQESPLRGGNQPMRLSSVNAHRLERMRTHGVFMERRAPNRRKFR